MSGLEAISVLTNIVQIISLGKEVLLRLNEFRQNVNDLPDSFTHVAVQLPLLLETLTRINEEASHGSVSPATENALKPVILSLRREIVKLDVVLRKVLPSANASTGQKVWKALRSVSLQKDVDEFAGVIRDYVINLTAFQVTQNGDRIVQLIKVIENQRLHEKIPMLEIFTPVCMLRYDTQYNDTEHFVGRQDVLGSIDTQFLDNNRVAIAGIGGVG